MTQTDFPPPSPEPETHHQWRQISRAIGTVVRGQEEAIETILLGLLAGGHVLLEGVPGLGKTLLVRVLSRVLQLDFGRIQFTPDLMPSDVTGGSIFNTKTNEFEFVRGPVFCQVLLADEINRATAKTQSALLEAMQEKSVTTDGVSRELPRPYFVLATQNPVESRGTHPLPEAQLDRFLLHVRLSYPERTDELTLLRDAANGFDAANLDAAKLEPLLTADQVRTAMAAVPRVQVADEILAYILDLVEATRNHPSIEIGASPRAAVGWIRAAQASATMQGRDFVLPDDVKQLARPLLRHRLSLHSDAEFEGRDADEILTGILRTVAAPSLPA